MYCYSICIFYKKAKILHKKLFISLIINCAFYVSFYSNCFFIYGIGFLHPAFWSYVASILRWLFIYRNCILHSAIMLPLIHSPCFVYGNLHFEIMLPGFHAPCFIYGICIMHSGIMLPRFHAPFYLGVAAKYSQLIEYSLPSHDVISYYISPC